MDGGYFGGWNLGKKGKIILPSFLSNPPLEKSVNFKNMTRLSRGLTSNFMEDLEDGWRIFWRMILENVNLTFHHPYKYKLW